ncbi:hypothetical protein [Leptospira perolatii]|uniref:hypothetical protein n=1 Tax=Leptospira perolatii TaxID=2023191 RepID=UPI000F642CAE|nr:hypothetical protein [Leptospira perolatii]
MNRFSFSFIILISSIAYQCTSLPEYREVNNSATQLLGDADRFIQEGNLEEASEILKYVYKLYPEDQRIAASLNKLPEKLKENVISKSHLSTNKSDRVFDDTGILERMAWYLPDRILDFLDIFSLNIKIGPQIGASAWITRGIQVTAYAGDTVQVGWFQKRNLGFMEEQSAEIGLGPYVPIGISGRKTGTAEEKDAYDSFTVHGPQSPVYQDYRDYWSVGSKLGVGLIGLETEVHLLEIADLIAGIFTIDFTNDDYAKSRPFKFTKTQKENLSKVKEALRNYKENEFKEIREQYLNSGVTPSVTETAETSKVEEKPKKKK